MRLRLRYVALATLLMTGPARAQTSDLDKAQAHFEAGRKLRASGHCDLALEEFTRAIDFEPNKVGPRLNLGDCYVELGRLPEAFRQFKDAERVAEATKDERRLANARTSAAQVEAKMVRVVLRQEGAASVDVDVDGVALGAAPWHIVVAPGTEHEIRASAADGRSWSAKASGKAGEVVRLTIALTAPKALPDELRAEPAKPEAETVEPRPSEFPWRTVGWATAGLGVLGLGIGTTFGILAAGDTSDAACDANDFCDPALLDSARSKATVANVGFIAGGVLLAGGIGLVLFAPHRATQVRLNGSGLLVEGRW